AANQNYGGGHIMTGPIYVEGAEPGDTLAIEYLALDTRVDYGFNNTSPTSGVMATTYPGWRAGDAAPEIPSDLPSPTHLDRTRNRAGEAGCPLPRPHQDPHTQFHGHDRHPPANR